LATLGPARPGVFARLVEWWAVGLGLAAVFAMSRLYMVPAQPMWNNVTTPVAFFATTLLVGIVVVLAFAGTMPAQDGGGAGSWLHALALAAILLVAVELAIVPAYLAALPREPAAAISSISTGSTAAWLAVARVFTGLGAVAVLLGLYRAAGTEILTRAGVVALLALVFTSETIGRVLFYLASTHLGPD
jgi:anaerobic dimethyl sulfoxide reductase subunit C (anchor subunit)